MSDFLFSETDVELLKAKVLEGDEKAAKVLLEVDKERRKREFREKLLNEEV